MTTYRIFLHVPRAHVKKVKSALEEKNMLDKNIKIYQEAKSNEEGSNVANMPPRTVIPTTVKYKQDRDIELEGSSFQHRKQEILSDLGLSLLQDEVTFSFHVELDSGKPATSAKNPLLKALAKGLETLPESLLDVLDLTPSMLLVSFPATYSIYSPMLLLPSHAFTSPPWARLLSSIRPSAPDLETLWKAFAGSLGVTHIAINASIPLLSDPLPNASMNERGKDNLLRSPVNLCPIYGDFGPPPTPPILSSPTPSDFQSAFWVSTKQNGIYQTWAPRYTMFSRGNIHEKTRLLTLPTVLLCVDEVESETETAKSDATKSRYGSGCTAVDLYAGIGYFSFSYKKAGVRKVLCWELNPWSVEGLRRGADLNNWSSSISVDIPCSEKAWDRCANEQLRIVPEADFVVFQQSNESAYDVISKFEQLPPIRHVNLGLLPSSRGSWPTAIRIIDEKLGGWLHVHENVATQEIDTEVDKAVNELQRILGAWTEEMRKAGKVTGRRTARCEHVERIKTYAPGVMHVVFDVWVDGITGHEHPM